jgi:hypothetical protein
MTQAASHPDTTNESARSEWIYLLLALVLSLLAALPLLLGPGIVNTRAGGDSPFLLLRVHQLGENLRAGVLPARWMPDAAYGLGYPAFNFYAAMPYYVASALDVAGAGVLWGIKLTQALGFALAGLGAYLLARTLRASPPAALAASAAYTLAPFHLVNVYVRGDSLSEFYAMGLYPLILWAILRLHRRRAAGGVALLALLYALLVLSHNISALIFTPLVLLWLLATAYRQGAFRWRGALVGGGGLALGLMLSAWFWMPALRESSLVQLGDQTTGYFHFAGHFLREDLLQWRWIHDYAIGGETEPFSMGLAQAVLAVAGLLALAVRHLRRQRTPSGYDVAAVALLGYTWLMTPLSRWLWETLPLLPYTQFPWRLLSVQALAIALCGGLVVDLWPRGWLRVALATLLTVSLVAAGLLDLKIDRLPLQEADVTAERLMLYEIYSGNVGGTVRYEYLPREMVPRPYTSAVLLNDGQKPAPRALEGRIGRAELLWRRPDAEYWRIAVIERALLAFHTTFYPGWEAVVDGAPQGVEPLQGLGLVGLGLEPGTHEVLLQFEHTPVRRYSTWLSLLAGVAWLATGGYALYRDRRRAWPGILVALALIVAMVGAGVVLRQGDAEPALYGPTVMDFVRAPYLHHEPGGVWLGAAHLTESTVAAREVQPGQTLEITLDWEAPCPTCLVRVRLTAATAHLFRPYPVWAEAKTAIETSRTVLSLPIPDETPPGIYSLRLDVKVDGDTEPMRAASGQEMARLSLTPVQVLPADRSSSSDAALGAFGQENRPVEISLLDVEALRDDEDLEVDLFWRSERQATRNYALSLRLKRADGETIVSRDLPPMLGGYPTFLWRPGERLTDRVILPLPDDQITLQPTDVLEIVLYDRLTLKGAGLVRVPLSQAMP